MFIGLTPEELLDDSTISTAEDFTMNDWDDIVSTDGTKTGSFLLSITNTNYAMEEDGDIAIKMEEEDDISTISGPELCELMPLVAVKLEDLDM